MCVIFRKRERRKHKEQLAMYLLCLNKNKYKNLKKYGNYASLFNPLIINNFSIKAFGLMDQDRDGTISVDDLKEVYSSLGLYFSFVIFK